MQFPQFAKFGKKSGRGQMEALSDEVSQLSQLSFQAPLELVNTGAGYSVRWAGEDHRLIEITGVSGTSPRKYSWKEVYVDSSGSYHDKPDGMTGSTSVNFALEVRNFPVATGMRFWATRVVNFYLFSAYVDASSTDIGLVNLSNQDMGRGIKNFKDGCLALYYGVPNDTNIGQFQDLSGIGVDRPSGIGMVITDPLFSTETCIFGLFPADSTTSDPTSPKYNPIVIPSASFAPGEYRQTVYACWNNLGTAYKIGQNGGIGSDCVFTGGVLTDVGSTPFFTSSDIPGALDGLGGFTGTL